MIKISYVMLVFAIHLTKQYPDKITIEQRIVDRGDKIFIDYARNSYGLNSIAPYSVRMKENAPIVTPLCWDELEDKSIHSQSFNIKNIFAKLDAVKDSWGKMQEQAYSLKQVEHEALKW